MTRSICRAIVVLSMMASPAVTFGSSHDHDAVLRQLRARACASLRTRATLAASCDPTFAAATAPPLPGATRIASQSVADGALIGRQRIASTADVALDVISYGSTGLVVGGLLCYPLDGQPHSTVIHVPGGAGGVFNGVAGDLVQTCIDWASLHGRTAFAPSLRGQDGGEGRTELCLGEADDVINAATMLRTLAVVDPRRVGLVGGSIGGCVALRAAPRIPDLAAVVAFVPPVSWKDLIHYHRTAWQPTTEITCDGREEARDIGGPSFADALDSLICGHADCSDAEYLARSPLPYIGVQTAPTLIVSSESDNIVPFEQQLLWSLFRQGTGHPVSIIEVDKCAAPGTPPAGMDAFVMARDAFHLMPSGPVSSGMLFLMHALDVKR